MEYKPPPVLISDKFFFTLRFTWTPLSILQTQKIADLTVHSRRVPQILWAPPTLTLDVEGKTDSPFVVFEVGGTWAGAWGCWCIALVVGVVSATAGYDGIASLGRFS